MAVWNSIRNISKWYKWNESNHCLISDKISESPLIYGWVILTIGHIPTGVEVINNA